MTGMAPGWYYAEGDPPGTQRYWDGTSWHGAPQPVMGQPTGPGFAQPTAMLYSETSQAVTALILSIVGFVVCCLLTCPIGWYIANQEISAINAGRRDPNNMSLANAARILGIIGTVLLALGVVGYGSIILLAGAATL